MPGGKDRGALAQVRENIGGKNVLVIHVAVLRDCFSSLAAALGDFLRAVAQDARGLKFRRGGGPDVVRAGAFDQVMQGAELRRAGVQFAQQPAEGGAHRRAEKFPREPLREAGGAPGYLNWLATYAIPYISAPGRV